ncbi:MAG TPA: acetolactate synthase [Acidimicrobiales bacterium]|nr:acetolactate synthase [Acidimicrobiales bacterium]
MNGHGGELAMAALSGYGVREIFTLSGGHIFPFYDACVRQELAIYDVRHEQTATFAAEGMGKLTRRPGVAVLTAGPGVTNGVSAMTTASFNGSPLVVLAGRAPQNRWGAGSLQELDHVPIVGPVMKLAATVATTADIAKVVGSAAATAITPHRGPVFVDFPMDVVFGSATDVQVEGAATPRGQVPDPADVAAAAELVRSAARPCLVAGSDVYWDGASEALRHCVEELRVPCFANGLGRGCLPADHELAFSRTRSMLKEADVVVVVGTPLDFRLSFGRFGSARVVHIVDAADNRAGHVPDAASVAGDIAMALEGLAASPAGSGRGPLVSHEPWISSLREREVAARASEASLLTSSSEPIHPARVYGELSRRLARDAVVIGDGGDFVSWAGRLVDSYQPGCWMDPGPYGCLGTGLGYAMAARVAHPERQVVLMLGDGAAGFSLLDVDSLVRHGLPVVMVVGNNGIWGLEKHPMRALYGYDVAADLQPECRYDSVVSALGGAGELVRRVDEVGPALDRALASGVPYLVNVVLDPDAVYPRSSNLA